MQKLSYWVRGGILGLIISLSIYVVAVLSSFAVPSVAFLIGGFTSFVSTTWISSLLGCSTSSFEEWSDMVRSNTFCGDLTYWLAGTQYLFIIEVTAIGILVGFIYGMVKNRHKM